MKKIIILLLITCSLCMVFALCAFASSKPGKVKGLKVSFIKNVNNPEVENIKISWKKVSGATKYEVYSYGYEKKNGKKKEVKESVTTKDTKIKLFALTYHSPIKYKVRAYKKGKWGSFSSSKKIIIKPVKPDKSQFYWLGGCSKCRNAYYGIDGLYLYWGEIGLTCYYATHYEVVLKKTGSKTIKKKCVPSDIFIDNLPNGTYSVKIYSVNGNGKSKPLCKTVKFYHKHVY